ncbi:recombinase family protein [Burkholderia sp. Ac-20345]|uniref:recombinase family protein n=1 Tax=Burkholderia sp. Ac-20345 TaxID=2703891 RepID=UPI00321693D7
MSRTVQRGAVAGGSWIVDLECTCESVGEQTCRMRAAEYVRMSTEHQQYSTENQRDRIRDYRCSQEINQEPRLATKHTGVKWRCCCWSGLAC